MTEIVTQYGLGLAGTPGDRHTPRIRTTFAQVKYILESYPELQGRVGHVVVKVWHEFYGLKALFDAGNYEAVTAIMAGAQPGVPNYKTVSRNYHRVCEKYPDLYRSPEEAGQ